MKVFYLFCLLIFVTEITGVPIVKKSLNTDINDNIFPFLIGLPEEDKNEFLSIVYSNSLTFAQTLKQSDAWAKKTR